MNKWTALSILSLACLTSNIDVHADSLIIHGLSKHFNSPDCTSIVKKGYQCTFNEQNYGLAYRDNIKTQFYFTSGAYKNSFSRLSTYIGGGYSFNQWSGIEIGIVTGYPMAYIVPMINPYFSLPIYDKLSLQIEAPFLPGNTQLLALSLEYKLWD